MAVRHLVSSNGCGFILRVLMFVVLSFSLFLISSTFSVFLNSSSSSFLPPRFSSSSSSSSLFSFFPSSFSTDFAAGEGGSAWRA